MANSIKLHHHVQEDPASLMLQFHADGMSRQNNRS